MVVVFACTFFSFEKNWTQLPWLLLLSLGLVALVAQCILMHATRFAPMRLIAPFLYFSVPVSAMMDAMFWDISLTYRVLIGCLFVVAGNILMVVLYSQKSD